MGEEENLTISKNTIKQDSDNTDEKESLLLYGFLLAEPMLDELRTGNLNIDLNLSSYLTKSEILGFSNALKSQTNDLVSRTALLEQIFVNTCERRKGNLKPPVSPEPHEVDRFMKELKVECILPFGHWLKEYMNKASVSKTYEEVKEEVFSLMFTKTDFPRNKFPAFQIENGNFINRKETDNDFKARIAKYMNGIRHESSFQELLLEGNFEEPCNIFPNINDASVEKDSKGADAILQVSVLRNPRTGVYKYPEKPEEESRCSIAEVSVDVKSTKGNAIGARREQNIFYQGKNFTHRPLIIWSHIYDRDYCLGFDDVKGQPSLLPPNKAKISLTVDMFDAMKLLGVKDNKGDFPIDYPNHNGVPINPEDFQSRYDDIKIDILEHINLGYCPVRNQESR